MNKLALVNLGDEFNLGSTGIKNVPAYSSVGSFISTILPNVYIIAGMICLFLLLGGGIMFIIGAGNQKAENIEGAKKTISAALLGFLIIFASYWIIQIIEIVTGVKILNPPIL